MELKSIIIIVVVIFIILIGAFYFVSVNNPSVSNSPNSASNTSNGQNIDGQSVLDISLDRTANIMSDFKKIPNDLSLSNYMVELNDLIKAF